MRFDWRLIPQRFAPRDFPRAEGILPVLFMRCMSLLLWRFSDAGMQRLSPRSDGRRPKSAKARSRGRFGTGVAAGAMGI